MKFFYLFHVISTFKILTKSSFISAANTYHFKIIVTAKVKLSYINQDGRTEILTEKKIAASSNWLVLLLILVLVIASYSTSN